MPALHIEDLSEKEKLKLEVEQLRKEVKLQRQQVRWPTIPECPLRNAPRSAVLVSRCVFLLAVSL